MMSLLASLGLRQRQSELMDQPQLDSRLHEHALSGLARLNRVSRSAAAIWRSIESMIRLDPGRRWRLLDVASGAGDVPLSISKRATKEGYSIQIYGCDISERAVAHAQRRASNLNVDATFFRHDVLAKGLPEDYDIVTSSLFLHHLEKADAVTLLKEIGAKATSLGVVSDLRRTKLGYAMAVVAGHGLTRSRIVHIDGPLSVRAAFTIEEVDALAKQAGLEGRFAIQRIWPQRFLLTVQGANR